jgi:hypothetical protein
MSGSEVIGDIAQGALTARAIEPAHGEASDGHTHESACLNCGTALVGSHCHACGQAAHVHRTLGAFFHDLLHGVFHFEGKIWRTLPMLAFRPGQLTREYIDGRRASYVSPIALFLFSVFLLFAAIHALAGDGVDQAINPNVDSALAEARSDLADLEATRTRRLADSRDVSALDTKIANERAAITKLGDLRARGITEVPEDLRGTIWHSDIGWLDALIKKASANPQLLLYKMQTSAYKYSWLLIPISVPFVWLLFPFSRRFGLYDHTVFVTYSLSFMTLLVIALSLAGWAGMAYVGALAVLLPPLHLYRQLKGTYALSRFGAVWRLAALLIVCLTALILFALAVASLGLSG